jgi:hypothetical protein
VPREAFLFQLGGQGDVRTRIDREPAADLRDNLRDAAASYAAGQLDGNFLVRPAADFG